MKRSGLESRHAPRFLFETVGDTIPAMNTFAKTLFTNKPALGKARAQKPNSGRGTLLCMRSTDISATAVT